MTKRKSIAAVIWISLLGWVALPMHAQGQTSAEKKKDMLPLSERPTLFGGPASPEQWQRDRGVGLDISWTQFGQAMTSPREGDNSVQLGGKLNAKFAFDGARLGLWEGLQVKF